MTDQCVSEGALAVLREIECDPDRTRITSGQLDRSLYEEVNEVLVRLGGKWKGGRTKAHLFPYDPRPLLAGVLATGHMPPKNPWAFFPTPSHLVTSVMEAPLFDTIQNGDSVLEPSAGFGALAEGMCTRLAHRQVQIDCCEILPINQQVLRSKGFEIVCDDFLIYKPEKRYRAIVMNPPFNLATDRYAYITHILHAWELLDEGGFLIAFAPSGYTFRSDKKSYDFLSFVLTYGSWEELPAKSFHESGTDSVITLMTLEKQDVSWRYRPYGGYPSWICQEIILSSDNGSEELNAARDRLIAQLDRGELCTDPKHPSWSHTQAAIREYYQRVIVDARKHGQHLDVQAHDWPRLEQNMMTWWNDTWKADDYQNEEATGIVVETASPKDTPVPLKREASTDLPMATTAGEEVESVLSPLLPIGTPLYSPLPCDASLSYEQFYAICEGQESLSRECYPTLPWSMETLIGTIWRNIHSGEAQTVHHIGINQFGRPVLCSAPAEPLRGQDQEIIGFWSGDRYIVEQWVRIDQQSEEAQLRWFGVELAWLRGKIVFCEDKIAEYRWDTTNHNLQKRAQKEYQLQLRVVETRMRDFAAGHHLSIPLEVLNSGIVGSERDPAQMALF
jgi:hypothetical protein